MAEQHFWQISTGKADPDGRSRLLMPVMEGHTLEDGDIASFLDGRLSSVEEESEAKETARLS